jgi:hypothetical protein
VPLRFDFRGIHCSETRLPMQAGRQNDEAPMTNDELGLISSRICH